ncbi:MAG: hypothetical protein CMN48_00350 [SAR116 cluster bacterium]|nr:hypothetical protein [SAR116 cluster bacterium]RPG93709.1 MAG: OmpH family outer membrane protein [Candidatus Puniceispirillum sp. TMED213]
MRQVALKRALIIFLTALFSIVALGTFAQQANESDEINFSVERVGIIDLSEVLRQSQATINVRDLLDEKRAEFQEQFAAREVQLLSREKSLKSKRDIMSKEAYEADVRLFQDEVAKVQREIQQKRKSLDNAFQQAQDKLRNLAIEIVGDIAKEQKLDLVANRSNVLVFRNQLDLTKIVLARLNERTKDARFEVKEVTSSTTTQ